MYLVIGSSKSAGIIQERLIKDFNLNSNNIINPEVYSLNLNYPNINQLEYLFNKYKTILISSLNTIEIVKQYIMCSHDIDYFVMGKSSYLELLKYTNNKIYYPINHTGYLALINEILASKLYITKTNTSNLLILSSNNNLQNQMINLFNNYFYDVKFLELYTTYYDFNIIDKDIEKITHVVINSSSVIGPLINHFKSRGYDYLKQFIFITYHFKIKNILQVNYKINNVIYCD